MKKKTQTTNTAGYRRKATTMKETLYYSNTNNFHIYLEIINHYATMSIEECNGNILYTYECDEEDLYDDMDYHKFAEFFDGAAMIADYVDTHNTDTDDMRYLLDVIDEIKTF